MVHGPVDLWETAPNLCAAYDGAGFRNSIQHGKASAVVDLVPRPDRYGDGEPDLQSVNGLIQARIDGLISRRDLVRRAVTLGIAAPVVGVMLHATSDLAFGAGCQHRARGRSDRARG